MPRFGWLFLLVVLAVAPGYRFRCWILCSDQTSVQHNYVEQRDRCREFAQLKLDLAIRAQTRPVDDTGRKALLVQLFSECMNNNGWNVPSPQTASGPAGPLPFGLAATAPVDTAQRAVASPGIEAQAGIAPVPERKAVMETSQDRAFLARAAECNFARYAAPTSSIAATRAQACDLECAQRLKAAPDAPRAAACPAEGIGSPSMATGRYKEE